MNQQFELQKWIVATRPWSFPASMMPALIVFSYVFYLSRTIGVSGVEVSNGLFALFGVVLFQASGNLISDYFDFRYGVDRKDTYGSSCLIVDGHFPPRSILRYGVVLLGIAIMIGVILLGKTDPRLLYFGFAGVAGTFFYYQFKYHALGDLLIFVLYGLLIALGTMYVMTGEMRWDILFLSAPVGLLIVNILHANNTRDIESDRRAGISTLAMRLGLPVSKALYMIHATSAYLLVLILILVGILPYPCLLVFLSAPISFQNMKIIYHVEEEHSELIKDLDKGSAKLVLVFSMLLIIGNVIAAFL